MLHLGVAELTLAPLSNFDIGALCSAAVALIAWRTRALTGGGALAAFAVGTATFGAMGVPGASLVLVFFVSSTVLSLVGRARKRGLAEIGKSGARDAAQVLANGGIGALCAVLSLWDARFALAFAGAFAAANADTWGTEIGTLVGARPRSILTLQPVSAGLSGGVTLAGTAAEVAGAAAVGAAGVVVAIGGFWPILAGGVAGAVLDSVLGASLQALHWCPQCRLHCESDPHACGANTTLVRGLGWFGNDIVNAAATGAGAAVAFALAGMH